MSSSSRTARSTPCARAARRGVAAARGAGAVARRRARDLADEPFAARRDPPPRGAAPARDRDGDRRRPGGRPARRGDRRARRAGRRASAARAPARPADARALPRRPAVGGARGLPRRARRCSSSRSASSPAPSCGALHEQILAHDPALDLPARGRAGAGGAAAPPRRARCWWARPRSCSPASWPSGSSACSSRTALRASARTQWADRPRRRPHHRAVLGRPRSRTRSTAGGGSVWVANGLDGTVSRIDRGPPGHDDRRRRRAHGARLRRRARCGWRTAKRASRAGRSGLEQGRCSGSRSATRRARSRSRRVRCGWSPASTAASTAIDLDHLQRGARSRSVRRRARSPPARARCGWRARRPGNVTRVDPRSGASSPRSPSATRRARWRWAKAPSGWPPQRRHALARGPEHERGDVDGARRPRPDRVSRSARARCGWPAARRAPWSGRLREPRVVKRRKTGSSPSALAVAGGSVWVAAVGARVGAPGRHAPRRPAVHR